MALPTTNIEKERDGSTNMVQMDEFDTVCHSFLLSNLHCPSCVSHIQQYLSKLQPTPISISPSLDSSWVIVQHKKHLPVRVIREALEDAGFIVCDVTPDDYLAGKPRPVEYQSYDGEIGYLDRFIDRFDSATKGGSIKISGPSKKHLQHCQACRLEASPKNGSSSTAALSATSPASQDAAIPSQSDEKLDTLVLVDSAKSQEVWRATLAIGGMTCASCSNMITEELQKNDWIKKVTVNLISNSATIDFTGQQHRRDIVEKVEDIGYDAMIDSVVNLKTLEDSASPSHDTTRHVEIAVDGMYCSHCPPRILIAVESFGDRIKVEKPLTLTNPILYISYKPQAPDFTIRNIMKRISDTSMNRNEPFRPSIYHPPTLEERSRLIHKRERRRIFIRVLVALITALPTLIIGIIYMSLVPATNPTRKFFMTPLQAGISRAQWALFIMATPIYFLCADVFHIRALKEIRAMWRPGNTAPFLHRFYRFGSMNLLMSLGTSIAYISSVAQLIAAGVHPSLVPDNNSFYFDSVVFLTLFLLVGRLIEAYSKAKTGDAVLMLGKLRPKEALLIEPGPSTRESTIEDNLANGTRESLRSVSADWLEYGDIVKVLHGGSPPCDGTVVQGETKFDESSLNGESKLIQKIIGDEVFSGTVNKGSPISIKITGVAGSSMLDQIVRAVREGQTRRAPMERIADTLTGYFVPLITLIAIATWLIWLVLGYSGTLPQDYLGDITRGWVTWSLQFAIAVFVVACPCGLALAAPTALFVGGGLAAQHGILVKGGGEAFEMASRLDCIVFDKTGTLTVGEQPAVTNSQRFSLGIKFGRNFSDSTKAILGMVQAIEDVSSHPVAKAVSRYCKDEHIIEAPLYLEMVEELVGKGMKGSFPCVTEEGEAVYIIVGNENLMSDNRVEIPLDVQTTLNIWKSACKSVALAAISIRSNAMGNSHFNLSPQVRNPEPASWHLAAIFAVADPIRPESPRIVENLKNRGLQVWMLSGDNQITANAVGAQVGIPAGNIIAGVLPGEKAVKIQYLQKSLKSRRGFKSGNEHAEKRALIAMVGDGINDSPALTTADVGIAIGSGSDIAISSAEFVLVSSNLNALITLLDLSVVVFRRIKFNFCWALVYNLVALPIAAGVLYPVVSNGHHIRLDPVWASLAMAASSISVVSSSLALRSRVPWIGFKVRKSVTDEVGQSS